MEKYEDLEENCRHKVVRSRKQKKIKKIKQILCKEGWSRKGKVVDGREE